MVGNYKGEKYKSKKYSKVMKKYMRNEEINLEENRKT